MSESSLLRRWAVALSLAATAAASIATSPAPPLMGLGDPSELVLTAERPTLTQQLRVRLELDRGLEGKEALALLRIGVRASYTPPPAGPDAGGPDAGGPDAGGTRSVESAVVLVVRDAASPERELFRGSGEPLIEVMRECEARTCEQTLALEWSLAQGAPSPVTVLTHSFLETALEPDDGRATVELLP